MTTNRRCGSFDLARFSVVACTLLPRFFSGAGGGVLVNAFPIAVTTTRRTGKLFSAASQQFAPSAATAASPLAEHGDWQAFFDEERYCLVYYFNTVTGTSQWEPPDNFPIPAVRHHQQQNNNNPVSSITITGIQQHTHQNNKRDDRRVQATRKAESKEKEGPSAFQWIVKGAFQAASDLIEKQQQQVAEKKKKPVKDSKPWWSFLVDGDDDSDARNVQRAAPKGTYEVVRHQPVTSRPPSQPKQQKKEPSFWDRLFSSPKSENHHSNHANGQPQDHVPSRRTQPSIGTTLQQQHTEWLKFMNDEDGDSSPTFPLVPPSEREAKLQQKLYADSLARQENLRRNYKAVQEHRSRTFSLSALKRDNPQAKEWHQFLSD